MEKTAKTRLKREILKVVIEENKKIANERQTATAKLIYEAFECTARSIDIIHEARASSVEEFLQLTSKVENVFPDDYGKENIEDTARIIYEKTRDRLNVKLFNKLLEEHSIVEIDRNRYESGRLFYVGKICARLERAKIKSLSLRQLDCVYKVMPKHCKQNAFKSFRDFGKTPFNMWGPDYLKNLGIGKITIIEDIIKDEEEFIKTKVKIWQPQRDELKLDAKLNSYDLVSKLGRPWVDSIYSATNYLAEHIKRLSK